VSSTLLPFFFFFSLFVCPLLLDRIKANGRQLDGTSRWQANGDLICFDENEGWKVMDEVALVFVFCSVLFRR